MTNTGGDDARKTADRVVRRERRRIRSLAVVTIGFWVLAALLIPSVYLPVGAKLKHYSQVLQAGAPPGFQTDPQRIDTAMAPLPTTQQIPAAVAQLQHQQWIVGQIIFHEWMVGAPKGS